MTDPTPTGYGETGEEEPGTPSAEQETTLTTDDEAQRDDVPVRPGNQSD